MACKRRIFHEKHMAYKTFSYKEEDGKKYVWDLETSGLDFFVDRILSIAVKNLETQESRCFYGPDEKKILEDFWAFIEEDCELISYNGDSFDCVGIIRRCLIWKVKMKRFKSVDLRKIAGGFWFSYNAHEKGKLSDWAQAFGILVKTPPGSEMPQLFLNGDWEAIKEHNFEDIELIQELYTRCEEAGLLNFNNCRR